MKKKPKGSGNASPVVKQLQLFGGTLSKESEMDLCLFRIQHLLSPTGVSDNQQTQASVSKRDMACQTDHVVVLTSGEAQQLASHAVVPVRGIRLSNRMTTLAEKVQGAASTERLL